MSLRMEYRIPKKFKLPATKPTPDYSLADKMLAHYDKAMHAVMEQREEILRAFVAKFGFNPDECEQVHEGNTWYVVRIDPAKVARIQKALIVARIAHGKLTRWQRFCLWMAGYGR